ncbi:MAG: hypothetical protein DMF49_03930, partial [Acidobacteria bacterium]
MGLQKAVHWKPRLESRGVAACQHEHVRPAREQAVRIESLPGDLGIVQTPQIDDAGVAGIGQKPAVSEGDRCPRMGPPQPGSEGGVDGP